VPDDVTFDVDPTGGWRPVAVIEGEVVDRAPRGGAGERGR
jgi:hypothetical protein